MPPLPKALSFKRRLLGLGYYRRATNLRRLAQVVVKSHSGRLPDSARTLEPLPGVDTNVAWEFNQAMMDLGATAAPCGLRA